MDDLRPRFALLVLVDKLEINRGADAIGVLDDTGRIVQQGTHDDLIDQQGQYRRFWEARTRASGWSLTESRH